MSAGETILVATGNLPDVFVDKIPDTTFAALVFVSPRSKKWPLVWGLCQKTQHLENDKNFLALFESGPGSIQLLGQVISEIYDWKSANLFIKGKQVRKSDMSQIITCYGQSLEHQEPMRAYCLRENEVYSFNNQLNNTAREGQHVSFITPCRLASSYATYSDNLPSSFEEQFHSAAVSRLAHLCPNYCLGNFQGPFLRKTQDRSTTYTIKLKVEEDTPSSVSVLAKQKKKMALWKKILLVLSGLAILGAIFGEKKENMDTAPPVQSSQQ